MTRSFGKRFGSRFVAGAAVAGLAVALAACGTSNDNGGSSTESSGVAKGSVKIAAFNFNESILLASMYQQVLEKAGYKASVVKLTTREVVQPALQKGDVQVVPEYLATLTEFLNGKKNGPDAKPLASGSTAATLAALKTLTPSFGITPLEPSPATDQNAFAVTKDLATVNHLETLSDLAAFSKTHRVVLGGPSECPKRPYCQPGLEQTYGMKIAGFKALDAGGPLTKTAIKNGQVTVGLVFSSDGGVPGLGLRILTDDKKLQNADNIIAVVNDKVNSSELASALNGVAAALTTDELVAMNRQTDIERKDPAVVAKAFLTSKGLLGS